MTEQIQIQGMGCAHCISAVRTALQKVDGVEVQEVEIGTARVRYESDDAKRAAVEQAIREAGYEPVSFTAE